MIDAERCGRIQAFARSVELELGEEECDLFNQALTHRSYAFERDVGFDNERLEFLGDAVLGLVVSQAVYDEFEDHHEGQLSQAKAAVVSRKTLGRRAREMGFGDVVLFGRGESRNGGRARPSTLGAALEAFVGALYVARGFNTAAEWIRGHVLSAARKEMIHGAARDYKSRLQEWTQANRGCLPQYHRLSESGPDHAKQFMVEVSIAGASFGRGIGPRLKDAEHAAAREALDRLGLLTPPGETG